MGYPMATCCVLSMLLLPLLANAAWTPGAVKRRFHETPKGALHYVVGGNVVDSDTPTMVFFHGHPRSTEMFRGFVEHLPKSQPFIAIDYYGAGSSDECDCNEKDDEFVTFETFAKYALDICKQEGVKSLIPFGALTGGSPAIELAVLAIEGGHQVHNLILSQAFYLNSSVVEYFSSGDYIEGIRHPIILQDGSHIVSSSNPHSAWYSPDGGPVAGDLNVPPSAVLPPNNTADLADNQIKTIDYLTMMQTGWQYKFAWTAYNDKIPSRFEKLVKNNVHTLFLHPEHADLVADLYGLEPTWSKEHFNDLIPNHLRTNKKIPGGNEGVLEQQGKLCARIVKRFLSNDSSSSNGSDEL